VSVELEAGPQAVLRAAVAAVEWSGHVVDAITARDGLAGGDDGAGRGSAGTIGQQDAVRYRVLARGEETGGTGPLLTILEVADVGAGRTSVRIVQCGFGDEREWAELLSQWRGRGARPRSVAVDLRRDPMVTRRSDSLLDGWFTPRGVAGSGWPSVPSEPLYPPLLPYPPQRSGGTCLPGLSPVPGSNRLRVLPGRADPDLVAQVMRAFAVALEKPARGDAQRDARR
jgi:hypothetical protein